MSSQQDRSFIHVTYTHFVPCIFIGIAVLYLVNGMLPDKSLAGIADNILSFVDISMGVMNGVIVAAIVISYHLRRNKRLIRGNAVARIPASPQTMMYAAIAAFISGGFGVILLLQVEGLIVITVVVMGILFWHLRAFSKTISIMLNPKSVATWGDVAEMVRIYITMLAGFTLLNASLEGAHIMAGHAPPFGFLQDGGEIFLNSLYYTVVTMTTLGYGDIVPHTWDAKLLLIVECLVSYFMFALAIGITTRGVIHAKDAGIE